MTRHHYRHYGLRLDISRPLPGATPSQAGIADITVEVLEPNSIAGTDLEWVMPDPSISLWRAQTDQGSWLRVRYFHGEDWVEYIVDGPGANVWVTRSSDVGWREAAGLLMGPVFSCILGQRGLTCLHAAVLALDGKVIALVGRSGAGKSTTALSLVRHGGSLISDDVAVLRDLDGRITVATGGSRLRMRPDAARSLLGSFESLEPTWSDGYAVKPKRYLTVPTVDAGTDGTGRCLDIVYLLTPWDEAIATPSLHHLSPARALAKLMAHRHMIQASTPAAHRRDFELLARLAETTPARDLARPAGIETMQQTVAAIVSDVRSRA